MFDMFGLLSNMLNSITQASNVAVNQANQNVVTPTQINATVEGMQYQPNGGVDFLAAAGEPPAWAPWHPEFEHRTDVQREQAFALQKTGYEHQYGTPLPAPQSTSQVPVPQLPTVKVPESPSGKPKPSIEGVQIVPPNEEPKVSPGQDLALRSLPEDVIKSPEVARRPGAVPAQRKVITPLPSGVPDTDYNPESNTPEEIVRRPDVYRSVTRAVAGREGKDIGPGSPRRFEPETSVAPEQGVSAESKRAIDRATATRTGKDSGPGSPRRFEPPQRLSTRGATLSPVEVPSPETPPVPDKVFRVPSTGNALINTPSGYASENSITVQDPADGRWINIPTILDGKQLTPEQAFDLYFEGENPRLGGRFGTRQEAVKEAVARAAKLNEEIDKLNLPEPPERYPALPKSADRSELPPDPPLPQRLDEAARESWRTKFVEEATSGRINYPLQLSTSGVTSLSDLPLSGGSRGSRIQGPIGQPSSRLGAEGLIIRGGRGHAGIDLPGNVGDPYLAHQNAVVIGKGFDANGYGHYLDVKFEDGTIHRIAHMGTKTQRAWPTYITRGAQIKAGQILGYVGHSGNASRNFPHVHMEVFDNWKNYKASFGVRGSRRGEFLRGDALKYWNNWSGNKTLPKASSSSSSSGALKRVNLTAYSPQDVGGPASRSMEGGREAAAPGLDGEWTVRTVTDYMNKKSKYITLAGNYAMRNAARKGNPRQYIIKSLPVIFDGKKTVLKNVPAVVHDTGSAFKRAPEGRFDIALGHNLTDRDMAINNALWGNLEFTKVK